MSNCPFSATNIPPPCPLTLPPVILPILFVFSSKLGTSLNVFFASRNPSGLPFMVNLPSTTITRPLIIGRCKFLLIICPLRLSSISAPSGTLIDPPTKASSSASSPKEVTPSVVLGAVQSSSIFTFILLVLKAAVTASFQIAAIFALLPVSSKS